MRVEHEYYKDFPRNFGFSINRWSLTLELGRHYLSIIFKEDDDEINTRA